MLNPDILKRRFLRSPLVQFCTALLLSLMFTATGVSAQVTTVGSIADQSLSLADGPQTIDVSGNFTNLDGNLTYTWLIRYDTIVTHVNVDITPAGVLTITPVAAGHGVLFIYARDGSSNNRLDSQ